MQVCVDPAGGVGVTYTDLQAALTAAQDNSLNDQIKVVQETYTGHFTYNSTKGYNLELLGGYTAGCAGRVLDPTNTILDGSGTGAVLTLNNYTSTGVASGYITVQGFTIQHGGGSGTYYGAGVFAESRNDSTSGIMDAGNIAIRNNIITENTAKTSGGGVYANSESLKGSSGIVTVSNNIITVNTATDNYGGGVYAMSHAYEGTAGEVILTNNIIAGNGSVMSGGGVYIDNSSPTAAPTTTLTNNTITGNNCSGSDGGGLFIGYGSAGCNINVYNNIIRGNTASSGGDDISFPSTSNASGYNNNYHVISGTWDSSGGIIDADPLFVDASVRNYHLLSTSPCINTGLNSAPSIPSTDIDGDTRIVNVTVDMGADEYVCPNQPALIGTSNYYDTIALAYTAASTGQTIKMQSYEFSEILNFSKIITLKGGYDCDYVTNTGTYSTISGSLTISGSGTVTVENIKIN